jgi:hypothetical protein
MDGSQTIRAVAIGKPSRSRDIKDSSTSLQGVRPYIKGLINWLHNQGGSPDYEGTLNTYDLGKNYTIEYRECEDSDAALQKSFSGSTDLIFCMSTAVANGAVKYNSDNKSTIPIVAIVSDPKPFLDNNYVCGVSAKRPEHVPKQYKEFINQLRSKNRPYAKIYALHKDNYSPSNDAKNWLGPKKITYIASKSQDDIQDIIQNQIPPGVHGLLILPADRFFGAADDIVQWADTQRNLPTFWPIADYPDGAFGGYGFAQELCGQYLAERVAQIWTNKAVPNDPSFTQVDEDLISRKR